AVAGARGLRPVRHPLRRPPGSAPYLSLGGLRRLSAAQGLLADLGRRPAPRPAALPQARAGLRRAHRPQLDRARTAPPILTNLHSSPLSIEMERGPGG